MRRLKIGRIYAHPNQGPIRILDGAYTIDGRISNHWHWVGVETGEENHGYGAPWRDITDEYVTITVRKDSIHGL